MTKQIFIDETLQLCLRRIAEEVGGLLGQEFACTPHQGRFATSAEVLAARQDRAALACMAISGEREGTAHIVLPLGSAIVLGATLILLPTEEIANRRRQFDFDGEVVDAFGEIANIIAGVYTAVCLEKFSRKIHFKKTSVAPLSSAADAPPEQTLVPEHFYLSKTDISLGGEELGSMDILIPCEVLGITPPAPGQTKAAKSAATGEAQEAGPKTTPGSRPTVQGGEPAPAAPALVLIMADQAEDGEQLAAPLRQGGFEVRGMALQESIREVTEGRRVAGVFVLLREVGERQLSALIKAQSALGPKVPLVVGGAAWTRNAVLQAVKYGARDILVTPADGEEILAKARAHMRL
jgi:hypothetical protein